tara:strand:- start:3271 stop:8499 length:5229 start_codon:yes stop_codon:yes gene_type:complete
MAIKFNVDPYYDDFLKAGADGLSPQEKYNKVLFRPGIAVQARELTQLQSILQNQVTQFGNHMFKEGSLVIPGGNSYNNNANYVKLSATNAATVGDALNGKMVANADGLRAKIIKAVAATGSDPDTFYVVYQNSNGATNANKVFSSSDSLTEKVWNSGTSSYDTGTLTATVASSAATGEGAFIQVEEGVYFIRGHFVIVKADILILSKYTNNISLDVGLEITEAVTTAAEDDTMNDNATGSPNYAAPGAHRYSIKTVLKTQANYGSTIENFLLLLRVVSGDVQKQVRTSDYSVIEDTLARRTYDESGDYTVRPFRATMKEDTDVNSPGDATKLVAAIEPSKAYVRGYEIQTLSTTNLSVNKAREAALFEGASVSSLIGNYINLLASTVTGLPDITTFGQIELRSATGGGGSIIGYARARSIEKDGTNYKLYLFDVLMNSNQTFSSVRSVKVGTTFAGNLVLLNSKAVINEPINNTAVFALPFDRVKTCDDGTGDFNYVYFSNKRFSPDTVSGGEATFTTTGSTELFEPFDNDNWILVVTSGSSAGTIVAVSSGDVSIAGNSQSVDISGLTSYNGDTVTLVAGIKKTLDHDAKSLTTSGSQNVHQVAFTVQSTIEAGDLALGKADGYRLLAIYMSPSFSTSATNAHTDVKEYYDFDNGQTDNFYGISKVTIKPGTNFVPTGRLLVKYEFFTHDGTGDFFSVDSYSGLTDDDGDTVTYEDIPSYTVKSSGKVIELRSAIDFRPRVSDAGGNFTGTGAVVKLCPEPATTFTTDIQYYLNRRDKVFLDKNGTFGVIEGVSSLNPELPDDPKDAMVLYQLLVPAYTLKPSDVEITVLDNKRYTMRDIGKIDRRVNTLEYYTALSFLEKEASDRQVVDSTGALQRFKNGFVVDSFKSYNVADVISPEFKAAIDPDQGILRPQFSQESTRLRFDSSASSGVVQTGDLVTLPYTSVALVKQEQASSTINVNPYDVFTWSGSLDLSPSSDEWRDVSRRPAVTIDNSGVTNAMLDQLNESTAFGTVWNNWQTQWSGTQTQTGNWITQGRRNTRTLTTTDSSNQTRVGTNTALAWSTQVDSQGDRIVSIDIIPFIRSRQISFRAVRMKPNTRVYAFFDGVDVSSFVREESSYTLWSNNDASVVTGQNAITSHPSTAGQLITDASGYITGSFFIPNNSATTFTTGSRVFRLTDSTTNATTNTTEAEASYSAIGLIDNVEEVFLSTRTPRVERSAVNDDRVIITNTRTETQTGWSDPLAQSFLIDETGGAYITKVDMYFATKDDNIPVTLQIREMVNGYPSPRVAPFGEVVLNPASVNISATAATATTFTFESPVFLQENVEYCVVLLANTNTYTVWHAVMGEEDLAGVKINKQPYAGVLFKSQNAATWTADQNADLKFNIHRAEFTIGATANLVLKNNEPENASLQYDPFKCTSGSAIVRVSHNNHGFFKHATINSSVTISGVATAIHGIPAAQLNATHVVSGVEQDSYTITVATSATSTGIGGAATIDATDNRAFQAFQTNIQQVLLTGTNVTWAAKTTSGLGLMETSRTPYVVDSAYSAIIPNETMYTSTTRVIATTDNKNVPTFLARGAFTSTRSNLSPAIDLERASVVTVGNRIDRPVATTTAGFNVVDGFVAETTAAVGSALAKYVTKTVLLNEASSTLKIFIDVARPNNTEFEVYYKTGADETEVNAAVWVLATPDNIIPVSDTGTFSEVEWTIDPAIDFKAFTTKLVMKSENPALVPKASAFRAIALV